MANKKFSEMDPTVSVTGGESVPILQSGVNKITTPAQIKSYIAAEPTSNKVTSISGASTNVQFPSAKLLYDQLLLKQAVLDGNGFIKASGTTITYDNSSYLTSLDGAELLTNKVTSLSVASTDDNYPSAKLLYDLLLTKQPNLDGTGFVKVSGTTVSYDNSTYLTSLSGAELLSNKVTSISGSSTDVQYPSAKLLYDKLITKQDTFNGNGLLRVTGTDLTYDNTAYLTSLTGAILADQSTPQTIGSTGNRLAKLWATDITITNAIVGLNHNDAANQQGGGATERYHLTAAQATIATQAATSLVSGYLSSTDWSTFNNKVYLHGVDTRVVGANNPLPTNLTTPLFTLETTTNPLNYYYIGSLVNVAINKAVILNDGTGPSTTSGVLVVGNHYKITTYVAGDNFTNIATGLEGVTNTTGFTFTATGTTPTTWSNGSTVQRIAMPGMYYIYFNGSTGNILQGGHPGISNTSNVILASVTWNGTDYGLINDERHGASRNHAWHQWAHDTIGVRYQSGITLTATGTGATATLATTLGEIHDEDIDFVVNAGTTCRHFWQTSASTFTFDKAISSRPFKYGVNNRPVYVNSSSSYALTELPGASNRFINFFYYVTTDLTCPIYMFVETATSASVLNGYTSLANARAIPFPNLTGLGISVELKPIYRLIVDTNGLVQAITAADDYRTVSSLPQAAGTVSTTAASVIFTPYSTIASGNIQNAIEELTDEKVNVTNPTATVAEYADNAAASLAGLGVGRIYRTGDALKIVHA